VFLDGQLYQIWDIVKSDFCADVYRLNRAILYEKMSDKLLICPIPGKINSPTIPDFFERTSCWKIIFSQGYKCQKWFNFSLAFL